MASVTPPVMAIHSAARSARSAWRRRSPRVPRVADRGWYGTCPRTGTHPLPAGGPYGERMAWPRISAYAVAGIVVAHVAAGMALLVAAPDRGIAGYFYFGFFAVLGLASAT